MNVKKVKILIISEQAGNVTDDSKLLCAVYRKGIGSSSSSPVLQALGA